MKKPFKINRPTPEESLAHLKNVREKRAVETKVKWQPGDTIPGKGIFIGTWQPKDREDKSLGKTFNVFAAPQDLTNNSGERLRLTFSDAVRCVSDLRDWNGHNGGDFENDTAVYAALKDGSYKGEWFIPTLDLLIGQDLEREKIQTDSIYEHRNKGSLKGTLSQDSGCWYWSCTEERDPPPVPCNAHLLMGIVVYIDFTARTSSYVRPVRVEPCP